MDIKTCISYLDFVVAECDRHLRNKQVTDDELVNLIIEFQRFQVQINESALPEGIKRKIAEIKLNYSIKAVERSSWFLMVAVLTFGSWAIILNMRRQAKRKEALNLLKFDATRLSSFIRFNY
jgi:hypothetical protein